MSSDQEKEQPARLGRLVSPPPENAHSPGLRVVGHFAAFVLGTMGVLNAGSPADYFLKFFLLWVLPCLLLAVYGFLNLFSELWSTNWEPALYEQGITLRRAKQLKTFKFNEVREIAIRERDLFESQVFYGWQWDVTLRSDQDRVVFRLRARDGQENSAGAFLDALRDRLAGIAGRRVRGGEALAGPGWRLTNTGFKAGSLEVPFDEIAGADLLGGHRIGVWKLGEERPFFSVPARSANAMVLHDVLASRLPSHALGLGRVQFEKRGFLAARGFACYERGLVKHSIVGRREIQFSEVGGITYRNWQIYFKRLYLFTILSLILHRRQGGEPFRVSLLKRQAGDRDLEGLRDRLAERLADALIEQLDRDGEIRWTGSLWLTRSGVRYATSPAQRPDQEPETSFIHYSQGVLYTFEGSDFYLYRKGDQRAICHESADAPNFFVGFFLFERLAAEARGARDVEGMG